MILILFVICLVNLIGMMLGKVDMSRAYCGIAAWCGGGPGDAMKLKMLLLFNKERGEDATGWVVNNEIIKDAVPCNKFLGDHELVLSPQNKNHNVILHARKSSSGYRMNPNHAHPFGMYKDQVEKARFDLVLAMNGTLMLLDEFAKHFDINYISTQHSDTQILAMAMANKGKDYIQVLEKYAGSATLVFYHPIHPNVMMVYKDPDKPLYSWQAYEDGMYISSMDESLRSIGAPKDAIKTFKNNHLYKIVKGEIKSEIEVTRDPVKYHYVAPTSSHFQNWAETNRTRNARAAAPAPAPSSCDYIESKITVEGGDGKIGFCLHKYLRNGHLLSYDKGPVFICNDGEIEFFSKKDNSAKVWFVEGMLIHNEDKYNDLIKLCKDETTGKISIKKFAKLPVSEQVKYSDAPLMCTLSGKQGRYWIMPSQISDDLISGKSVVCYYPRFTNLELVMEVTDIIMGGKSTVCKLTDVKTVTKANDRHLIVMNNPAITKVFDIEEAKVYRKIDFIHLLPTEYKPELTLSDRLKMKGIKSADVVSAIEDYVNNFNIVEAIPLFETICLNVFKENKSKAMIEFFFRDHLFVFLRNEKVLSEERATTIITRAKTYSWDDLKIAEYLSEKIEQYRDEYKENISPKLSELNTKQLVDLKDTQAVTGYTNADILKQIFDSNTYLANAGFLKEFGTKEYPTLTSFAQDYCIVPEAFDNADTRSFYEAILLKLNGDGLLSDDKLFSYLDLTKCSELANKASLEYNSAFEEFEEEEMNEDNLNEDIANFISTVISEEKELLESLNKYPKSIRDSQSAKDLVVFLEDINRIVTKQFEDDDVKEMKQMIVTLKQ